MRTAQKTQRTTLTFLLVLLAGIPMMAEGLWGAKASLDINVPGKWKVGDYSTKLYKSGVGFSVGGVYTNYVTDNFFIEPSLSVFYDTYSCDFTIQSDVNSIGVEPRTYKWGMRLPLVVGYTFDITDVFAVTVFTGPEFDYAFAGGYRLKDKTLQKEIDDTLFGKEDGQQRRVSCSWKGGIAFPFSNWRIDLEAVAGITDIIVGPASMKENRVCLSLLRYF